MYCRTCGNKMNDNAEICVKCGVRRFVGYDYCQVCGAKTNESMKNCVKCKAVLKTSMSTTQIKQAASSGVKKVARIIAQLFSMLLFAFGGIQFIMGVLQSNPYYAAHRFSGATRCLIFAVAFMIVARALKGKTKKKKK